MKQSTCSVRELYPRHFTDVFGFFGDNQNGSHRSDDVSRLKRRPKCKSRNKYTDECSTKICDDYSYKAMPFALQNYTVVLPSPTDGCPGVNQLELPDMETTEFIDINVQRMDSLPVFDILCSSLQSSETVTAHQAGALSRWLSRRHTVKTATSSLVQILMASRCPLVSLSCCRILKQLCAMSNVTSCRCPLNADMTSYVLCLQKEMVKFLETGQFGMNLLNVIHLLDCITATCRNVPAYNCNKLRFSSLSYSQWCSSELRCSVLTVVSLADVISAKVKLTSAISPATHTVSNDDVHSARMHMDRVPQIVGTMLSTSVQCEVAQVRNISRILTEYWHTTDFCQRRLIVESVSLPKPRMELCTMILARHCDILLRECFASSLSLDDFFGIFAESVIISAITQRVWMEGDGSSVVSHCQEVCLILCCAVCSYILYQKGELVKYTWRQSYHIVAVMSFCIYLILDPETGPQALPTLFFLFLLLLLSDFQFPKDLHFTANRNEPFHTYSSQYSASSYRGEFLL